MLLEPTQSPGLPGWNLDPWILASCSAPRNVVAGVLPSGKAEKVRELQRRASRVFGARGCVLFDLGCPIGACLKKTRVGQLLTS